MSQNPNGWSVGEWAFHPARNHLCQVIETRTLWGEQTVRIWLPTTNRVFCGYSIVWSGTIQCDLVPLFHRKRAAVRRTE